MFKKNLVILLSLFSFQLLLGATAEKEFEKTIKVESGSTVHVKNVNGTINVTTGNGMEVEIFAEIKVKYSNRGGAEDFLDKVTIQVEDEGENLYIQPDHPKIDNNDFTDWIFGSSKPQVVVNFDIKVPNDAGIEVNSVNGSIEVKNIGGDTKLGTVNGKIEARDMRANVNAGSTNGGIMVQIADVKKINDMNFHTVNGGITVFLPENINANINLSTVNGGIHSDFPVTINSGKWGDKNISGKINSGGNEIILSTVNGGISLNQYRN